MMINIVGVRNDVMTHEDEAIYYYIRYVYDCCLMMLSLTKII